MHFSVFVMLYILPRKGNNIYTMRKWRKSRMNVKVEQDICIGCGLCTSTVCDVFCMNDSGKAETYSDVSESEKDAVQEAIDACPVEAISWM